MEISGPPPAPIPPRQLQALTRNWQLGQVIQATVAKQPSAQTTVLQISNLQIQAQTTAPLSVGQQLSAEIIKLGNRPVLQIQTASSAQPSSANASANAPAARIELQLATAVLSKAAPKPQTANAPVSTVPIEQALKQLLPKQASMSTLLNNVAWINSGKAASVTLPPAITELSKELIKALPERARISQPEVLKQALRDSGIFLENKLLKLPSQTPAQGMKPSLLGEAARMATPLATPGGEKSTSSEKIGGDLKLALIRLISNIRQITTANQARVPQSPTPTSPQATRLPELLVPAPTLPNSAPQPQRSAPANLANISNMLVLLQELGRQAEASLARTQLHQIASTTTVVDGNTQQWALELPVRNQDQVDIFDMVIEDDQRRASDEDESQHRWSVNLAFDLPGLGPVHVKLQMIDNKIATRFWAEEVHTSQLFQEHMGELLRRYHEHGVEPAEFHSFHGKPPVSQQQQQSHSVLDEKA